jgi:hypothetical protein
VALLSRYANSAASIIDMSASPHKGELDEFLANDRPLRKVSLLLLGGLFCGWRFGLLPDSAKVIYCLRALEWPP